MDFDPKLDVFGDGAGLDVKNDRVVDLDVWVGVSDGAGVVGDQEWDSLKSEIFKKFWSVS